jgi:hypothetical protein
MTRRLAASVTALVLAAGAGSVAQKVVSTDEFDRAMKTIGAAFDSVKQAIDSKSYVEAKTPLALSRQTLASTRPFWDAQQNPDAAKKTREAVANLDALDKALSPQAVDAAAVGVAFDTATRACDACHATHREGDQQTGYRIKSAGR